MSLRIFCVFLHNLGKIQSFAKKSGFWPKNQDRIPILQSCRAHRVEHGINSHEDEPQELVEESDDDETILDWWRVEIRAEVVEEDIYKANKVPIRQYGA